MQFALHKCKANCIFILINIQDFNNQGFALINRLKPVSRFEV